MALTSVYLLLRFPLLLLVTIIIVISTLSNCLFKCPDDTQKRSKQNSPLVFLLLLLVLFSSLRLFRDHFHYFWLAFSTVLLFRKCAVGETLEFDKFTI